jgi:hypothetical protein
MQSMQINITGRHANLVRLCYPRYLGLGSRGSQPHVAHTYRCATSFLLGLLLTQLPRNVQNYSYTSVSMQRTLSYDDIELLTSTAQRSKSNDFYQLKALDKEWTRSWNTLTSDTDRTTSRPVRSDNTTWQTPRSLPIWALIDVAQDNHHWTERNSPKHILNFVNRTSPPHESLQNGEFRLLRIDDGKGDDVLRCKISNTPLHESDGKYLALSYCWGPSTQLQKVIFLNGRATLVGESLFSCLSNFRQVSDLTSACHWIDALCIRQDDVQEKNSQIPLMGRIYSAARSVNIWLGAEENDSGYVLDTMYGSEIDALTDMKFIRGFTHLLWRPWFGRLWVR